MDPEKQRYRKKRIAKWNTVSKQKENPRRAGAFYHKLLHHYYKFLIRPGLRILELGCAHGDLLASLKPSLGVGVDFSGQMIKRASMKHPRLLFIQGDAHEIAFKGKFDVIILSDLVNDVWDVQRIFEKLSALTHPGTRLVINFYNNLWRTPLTVVKRLRLGAQLLEQNWFSPHDVRNLLELAGFEVIKHNPCILFPLHIPVVSSLANRFLVNFLPFKWFGLTNFLIARPTPDRRQYGSGEPPSASIIVAARNEAGNIKNILKRVPSLGKATYLWRTLEAARKNPLFFIESSVGLEGHERDAASE